MGQHWRKAVAAPSCSVVLVLAMLAALVVIAAVALAAKV